MAGSASIATDDDLSPLQETSLFCQFASKPSRRLSYDQDSLSQIPSLKLAEITRRGGGNGLGWLGKSSPKKKKKKYVPGGFMLNRLSKVNTTAEQSAASTVPKTGVYRVPPPSNHSSPCVVVEL